MIIPNVSYGYFMWGEADLIAITKNYYLIEGELKESYSDLIADTKKKKWDGWYVKWKQDIKKHFYIIPDEIYSRAMEKIRPESGIITYEKKEFDYCLRVRRDAISNIEAKKLTDKQILKITRLIAYRYWTIVKQWEGETCLQEQKGTD